MSLYNKVLSRVSPAALLSALAKFSTFIIESDGVVFAGDQLLQGSLESIKSLESLGKNIIFYPNSTSRSRETFQRKLEKLGIFADISRIFTPSFITAQYLKKYHPEIKKVFVIGKSGMIDELRLAGLEIAEIGDFEEHSHGGSKFVKEFDREQEIKAVIVSFDESFSFQKVMLSTMLLHRKDILFIATNTLPYLLVNGKKYPGVGPLIEAVVCTSNRHPDVITGRPNPIMTFLLKESFPELELDKTCLIGEKISTDLDFVKASKIKMMLALSGVTQPQDLESIIASDVDYVIHSFGDIAKILNN
jgi:phosphoglycolate/pyridoxal phosphate phosphatase family enzyme